jgi:ATP-dependent DNA helicase Q1
MHLILSGYLAEKFTQTAYTVNVYINSGQNALRLSRFSREALKNSIAPKIECWFRKPERRIKTGGKGGVKANGKAGDKLSGKSQRKSPRNKRKRQALSSENDGDGDDEDAGLILPDSEDEGDVRIPRNPLQIQQSDEDSDAHNDSYSWTSITRAARPPAKKPRKNDASRRIVMEDDKEVLVLSSD